MTFEIYNKTKMLVRFYLCARCIGKSECRTCRSLKICTQIARLPLGPFHVHHDFSMKILLYKFRTNLPRTVYFLNSCRNQPWIYFLKNYWFSKNGAVGVMRKTLTGPNVPGAVILDFVNRWLFYFVQDEKSFLFPEFLNSPSILSYSLNQSKLKLLVQ